MKVAFFFCENPEDAKSFPIAVGLLGAILEKLGHEVKGIYVHADPHNQEVMNGITAQIKEFDPALICFTATSYAFDFVKIIAADLRKNFNLPTLCGGYHSILYPEDCARAEGIDYVCTGDGEETIKEFVTALASGSDFSKVPNLCWIDKDGKLAKNCMQPLSQDIDQYPFVDYDVFGKDIIKEISADGWLRHITSRGCPYNCTYCHIKMIRKVYQKEIGVTASKLGFLRFRSIDSVIDELNIMIKQYDLKVINFMDDLFAIKRDRTMEFCEKFKERIPEHVGYSIQTHLEHLDPELVNAFLDSRCLRVVVGLESASKRILEIFRRPTSQAKMHSKLKLLADAKFPLGTWTLNILANPTETQEEMVETLAFNAACGIERVKVNFMTPYPKSDIYEYCIKNDLFMDEERVNNAKFGDRFITNLKFPDREMAFLEKFWDVGHWYMNLSVPSNIADTYKPLIEDVEKVPFGKWDEVKDRYIKIDRDVTGNWLRKGIPSYNFVFKGKVCGKVLGIIGGDVMETTKETFDLDWTESSNEHYGHDLTA